ncbi:MAG: PxxKW family cysteine-rich protein [Deltaproteobacteria bacterium]|nr:PxxKW family cysteine-rich protein [Deltaproteobacteria bacterium]MBW2490803.1 PxxKW family cysteine-rich protein [Deltaproteobacteria bacterium]
MVCTTIRRGFECPFMTPKGCSYNGGICHEIVESCNGCKKSVEISSKWYCSACPDPSLKWKIGNCNIASHVAKITSTSNVKINPLKASKRGNR